MKTGKEIKTKEFKNYNVTFGSIDNKNPKAVYINISAWADPISPNNSNYNRTIRNLHKNIKQLVFNFLYSDESKTFDYNRNIIDLDIRESGIKYGKRSFMSCEITLFSELEHQVNSEYMKDILTEISRHVILNIFEDDESFKFYNKKK